LVTKQWVFACLNRSRLVDPHNYIHPLQRPPVHVQASESASAGSGSSVERGFTSATSALPVAATNPPRTTSSSNISHAVPSAAAAAAGGPLNNASDKGSLILIPENKNEHLTSLLAQLRDVYAAINDEYRKVSTYRCGCAYESERCVGVRSLLWFRRGSLLASEPFSFPFYFPLLLPCSQPTQPIHPAIPIPT
jgi:hypothetical protein